MGTRCREGFDNARFTEPVTVPCLYLTGITIEIRRHVVSFVGWSATPDLTGEGDERRIVARFTTDEDGAWNLRDSLVNILRHCER
jgi:hypothetical protein